MMVDTLDDSQILVDLNVDDFRSLSVLAGQLPYKFIEEDIDLLDVVEVVSLLVGRQYGLTVIGVHGDFPASAAYSLHQERYGKLIL